jgi:hypothetical protein
MSFRREKISMEKKLLKINALLLPNYKNHFEVLKKYMVNGPKMDFQICEFLLFFGPPYNELTSLKY